MTVPTLRRHAIAAAALCCAAGAAQAAPYRAAATAADVLASLASNAGGRLTSAAQPTTSYNTVYAAPGAVLLADNAAAAPADRAVNFLNLYGALPGVTDATQQLQVQRVSTDVAGFQHVHLDQVQSGLPVFGARLVVHMNAQGVTGVNGAFVKGLEGLSTTPAQSYATLQATALRAAQKLHPGQALAVESSRLMFYNTGMLIGTEGSNRLAYEVMVKGASAPGIRERMILDANQNTLLNRINEIQSAAAAPVTVPNRAIYTPVLVNPATNTEATPTLTETTPSPVKPADPAFVGDTKGSPASTRTHGPGTEPLENLFIYAGGTYNLYYKLFGANGYDFTRPHSPQIQKSVYLVNNQCPNAYWDGTSTNYCPDFDADDVVSHEWSHAYTEYTHGLVYQYQSGALNESYSDIFGETYDLIDGFEGPQGASLTEGTTYDKMGSRWVVGEDLSQAAAAVLLRDMWDPDTFPTPSPGSVVTSTNYYCGTSDNGGVHTNSGVSNHAYAMLVDGKTFNNVTVPGIGLYKAAAIHFYAEKNIQTPTTNYPAHADALEMACAALIGTKPNDVFGKPIADAITSADCDAVKKVNLAVEFRASPAAKCKYVPVLQPEATTPKVSDATICGAGKVGANFFSENFEGTAGAAIPATWSQGKNLTGDKDIAPWVTTSDLPYTHKGLGRAAFFRNDTGGTCSTGGDESASHYMDTPKITTPDTTGFLKFTHLVQAESGFDGGNLKVSVNGGAFVIVPIAAAATTTKAAVAGAFAYNGHSGAFTAGPPVAGGPADPSGLTGNNTNPNAGQKAWTGSDQGDATSQWGTTIVDLSKLTTPATKGGTVQFRFDFGNDGCGGNLGWYVDDVSAFQCVVNTAPLSKFNTVTPASPTTADVVTFDASASSDADAGDSVASYALDFGDGSAVATQASPVFKHTYAAAKTYTAKLTVTDTRGVAGNTVTKDVTVTAPVVTAFTFAERKDVDVSMVVSSGEVTLAGTAGASFPISIAGGTSSQYSIDGGAFTSDPGTIKVGQKLVVRQTSAAAYATKTTETVTVGGYSTPFDVTTKAQPASTGGNTGTGTGGSTGTGQDHVPDAFDFGTQDGVDPGKVYTSKAVVPVNYDDAPISASQVSYSIDGAPFTTAAGTIKKGQSVRVQMTSSKSSLGYAKGYIAIGGVKGYYTLRTRK